MNGFLLDTNIVSELVKPHPEPRVTGWIDAIHEDLLYLSVLTLGEIRKGIGTLRDARRRVRLEAWLSSELGSRFAGRILQVDLSVVDRWGRLAAEAVAAGMPLPVIDGILAATALEYNLTFVTRNTADVSSTGVPIFNPWANS